MSNGLRAGKCVVALDFDCESMSPLYALNEDPEMSDWTEDLLKARLFTPSAAILHIVRLCAEYGANTAIALHNSGETRSFSPAPYRFATLSQGRLLGMLQGGCIRDP